MAHLKHTLTADHTAVVTGAASGIGLRLSERLIEAGCRVALTDIHDAPLRERLATGEWPEDRVIVQALDVRDPQAWDDALERVTRAWGKLDLAFNVAGYLKPGYTHQFEAKEVHRHLDINTKGVIFGTRAAARVMTLQRSGHIVNIGSLASLAPVPGLSLYSASKFAVRGYSLAAAQELKPHGVSVSVVLPDAVQTPMLDLQVDYDEAAMTFSGNPNPLTPDDIVDAIFDHVLPGRPMELALPASRGVLARIANLMPDLSRILGPLLTRRGLAAQRTRRR